MKSGFDRLARPYRWLEYLSFGRTLERCRCRFLTEVADTRRALLLGDGDGRFAASLLRAAPLVQVQAVDGSAAMLAALEKRCAAVGGGSRVVIHVANLADGMPVLKSEPFDLIVTHFFLDCLSEPEIGTLVEGMKPLLGKRVRWLVSEFSIPNGSMRIPARLVVGGLYAAFGLLAGLRTRHLPDHAAILSRYGFMRERSATSMCGLLLSELWVRTDSLTSAHSWPGTPAA